MGCCFRTQNEDDFELHKQSDGSLSLSIDEAFGERVCITLTHYEADVVFAYLRGTLNESTSEPRGERG